MWQYNSPDGSSTPSACIAGIAGTAGTADAFPDDSASTPGIQLAFFGFALQCAAPAAGAAALAGVGTAAAPTAWSETDPAAPVAAGAAA